MLQIVVDFTGGSKGGLQDQPTGLLKLLMRFFSGSSVGSEQHLCQSLPILTSPNATKGTGTASSTHPLHCQPNTTKANWVRLTNKVTWEASKLKKMMIDFKTRVAKNGDQ